jgi:SAM-dependent methyltransferase
MRAINSPSTFNPLEERILGSIPEGSKHVAVIGDGDGRLGRGVRAKLGASVRIHLVESRGALHKYLDDFPGFGRDPWDVAAFEAATKAHGPFDAIVFYGLHEYWHGQLYRLQQLLALARPGAVVWATFINTSALRLVEQQLPPLKVTADSLAANDRFWPRMDYATWVAAGSMLEARVDGVWGLLDKQAFDYCQSDKVGEPVEWNVKGAKVPARTPAEVVQWGASYLGIQMTARPAAASATAGQALSGVAYNPHLFQALANPFPEVDGEEGELAWSSTEIAAITAGRKILRPSQIVEFILQQVDSADSLRDVLLVGAGWGRDLMMLKIGRPQWMPVGVETSAALRALGRPVMAQEGMRVEPFEIGGRLPFDDKSFDIVVTLGFMSKLYDQAAVAVAREMIRVARKGIYHLEDARGPEQTLKIKLNLLAEAYAACGRVAEARPLMAQDQFTGFVLHKVTL